MSLATQTHAVRRTLLIVGALVVTSSAVHAQAPAPVEGRWEVLAPSGWLIPTGAQKHAVERGGLTALQASFVIRPPVAITATLGWARSRDVAAVSEPKVDVFTYDVGAEARLPRWLTAGRLGFRPFAGVGIGARSYNYRSLDVDATHNLAAYASVGGELGIWKVRLRLEARDYVASFKPLSGQGATATRNDVAVMAGLRITNW